MPPALSTNSVLQRVERLLRAECGLPKDALVLVGVSGGPDSVCLLHALCALGHRPIVAHFDHQLRANSTSESAFVGNLAASLGLHFVSGGEDVGAYARSRSGSIEEAGRLLRYAFLFAQARTHAALAVVVGHTADDQAETVLMHLLRGTGMSGLSGMAYRVALPEFDESIPVLRPLLDTWRHETLEYCRIHALQTIHDPSNESREFMRNRIRLDLIPSLEAYNPQIRRGLWRLSHSAAADLAIVQQSVTDAWARVVPQTGRAYVGFDAARLAAEAPALQRRLVMRAALEIQPESELGFADLKRAEEFISDQSIHIAQLAGGLIMYREPPSVFVTLGEQHLPSDRWPQLPLASIDLRRQAAVTVPLHAGWEFSSQLLDDVPAASAYDSSRDPFRALLDADALPPELELRVPRLGDRIQPLGLQGRRQKLSDVFINLGVPERLRARWPVLASGASVLWVPGFRIAESCRIRSETRRVVSVAVHRSG